MTISARVSRQQFEDVFPKLVADLKEHAAKYNLPEQAMKWFDKSLNYNTLGGKYNRGISVIDSAQLLLGRDLTEDEFFKTATLGWMIELLQAFFLVSDDIMDSSKTRRGQPCWYLAKDVGMIAINDAFMLESGIYLLLKKYFRQESYYVDLLELFHEVTFQTELGQLCDLLTAPEEHVDLDNFSMEKYTFIVIYKTAYYSFYLPVALAMHFTGHASPENLKQAHDILIPMGEYFQVQDDYLDNFADPSVLGKIGTDIMDNKCSWLVNQALKKCSEEQRGVLERNYGQKNQRAEAEVKRLYNELGLEKDYQQYEEKVTGMLRERIANIDESQGLKKGVFEEFLRKIYKRIIMPPISFNTPFNVSLGLEGTSVLITGGLGLIGRVVSQAFLSAGCKVTIVDLETDDPDRLLTGHLTNLLFVAADITIPEQIDNAFRAAEHRFKRPVDCCIALASLDLSVLPQTESICDMDPAVWERVFDVNVKGTFLTCQRWLKGIRQATQDPDTATKLKNVSCVIMGSEAGRFAVRTMPAYAAGKSAVQYGLLQSLAYDAPRIHPRARVNAVAPGPVDAARFAEESARYGDQWRYQECEATVPLARPVPVEDVARSILMLASERFSGSVHGQVLPVDGGKAGAVAWSREELAETREKGWQS